MEIKVESENQDIDSSLSKALTMVNTQPEEAAQNINRSRLFEINPDSYKELKPELEPEAISIERTPAQVGPVTQEYTKQSEQHASLVQNDLSLLDKIERRFSYYKQQIFDLPETTREINELVGKKMTEGKLSQGEEEQLQNLNMVAAEISQQAPEEVGEGEKFAVEVLSSTGDFVRSYWENKGILAAGVGGGAAIGAAVASFIPTPVTVGAGATAGAIKGFVASSTLIGFLDGYTQTSRGLYNELSLSTNEKGEPLNLPHDRMVKVSQGVGLISGIVSAAAEGVIARANPITKKFASPKLASKLVTGNAAMLARMEILGGIAESIFAEGGAEGLSEFTKVIGQNFAQMDESEASFMNAIENSLNSETAKKVGKAVAVGGATGGLISSVTGAAGYAGMKERYDQIQQVAKKRQEVLVTQNTILEAAKDMKATKMYELSPVEMNNFNKKLLATVGINENVWFTLDNLREFSSDPEKGAVARKMIDPTGEITKLAQELNTPIEVSTADLLNIVTEYPDITDYMQLTPDGETPIQSRTKAQSFVDRLGEAETKRAAILESLGVDEEMSPEMQAELESLRVLADEPSPYVDQYDYLDSQTFTETPAGMSKEEAQTFNDAHLRARMEVAKTLIADVDDKFESIENRIFKDVNAKDIQADIVRLDKEFKILERFNDRKVTNAITVQHKQRGFSPSAIDPNTLPEDLKEIYLNDETLKRRKVFIEGGVDLEESAIMNGARSGADLLRILSETPSRKEVVNNRKQREIELKNRINQTLKPSRMAERDKAFSNLTKIHIREMKFMREKEWTTTKRGIMKIALPIPTEAELNSKAKATISKMKIREINPTRFKVGESKSQRAALKNFLDGKFEQAFSDKEKAALNNEMRKEAFNVVEKVNKYKSFWKRVDTPSVRQELKDAGYADAMNEFLSVYQLEAPIRGEIKQNAFNNFIKAQVEAGNYTPVVPDRLDNVQISYKDLTFEQYQAITEMGEYMVHQAKLKNKLLKSQEAKAELNTAEAIAENIEKLTTKNVNYDPTKAERKSERYMSFTESVKNKFQTMLSSVSSIKTIVSELDEYKLNGYFHQIIGQPIKEARTAKRLEMREIENSDRSIIEKFYGVENFKKQFNEFRSIPEFADIPTLGDGEGNIRKVDLLTLQAYMGDPEGREAVTNFVSRKGKRLTIEEITNVLNRELDSNDAAFVQNFMVDRFKRFEQRSFDLHKRTTGIEPEMVKGVSVVHKDKVLPGGYFPIKRQMLPDEARAAKFFQSLKEGSETLLGDQEGHFYSAMRAAEMTQQGRLKERTGSERPLDLTFENIFDFTEEAIHDIHFREVGIDVLKVLKNPLNVKNIKAVVGPKKFASLLNGVKDVVSKTTERESTLFAEEYQMLNKVIQKAHSLHAIKAIGLNLTSAAIQADSLSNVTLRLGPKSAIYLAKTAKKIGTNLNSYGEYLNMAGQINPDIILEKDGIDNSVIKTSNDFIPASTTFFKNYKTKSGETISKIRELQRDASDASFFLVRESDRFNKVLVTMATSEQFLNGDIEGFPIEKINKMSDAEKAKTLRSVVQQAIDLTLTASAPEDKTALEKNKVANLFVRYWTDRRSRLNTVLAQVDKIKGSIKRGENSKAASNMVMLGLASGTSAAFVNMIRNKEESIWEKLKKIEDQDDVADFAIDMGWNFLKAPVEQTLDVIPVVDSIKYQTELDIRSDYRNVSVPLFGVASDISMGIIATRDFLNMAIQSKSLSKSYTMLSDVQKKALLTNAGYIVGGAPTNGMNKALESLSSGEVRRGGTFLADIIDELNQEIKAYEKVFKDEPEAKEFIQDLKEYQRTLPQSDSSQVVPENSMEVIREISSQGIWNKVDPDTGAAGVFQFTEERWNEIMALNPDLGLTENGRVAKNFEQQERAMQWSLEDNTRSFMAYEVPVTITNLLGAHKFGFENYLTIFSSDGNKKLSEVLGDQANNPVFKNFKTVKSVKEYLSREVRKISQED